MKIFKRKREREKEIVELLKNIDKKISTIEKCVIENPNTHGQRYFLVTGHWNT